MEREALRARLRLAEGQRDALRIALSDLAADAHAIEASHHAGLKGADDTWSALYQSINTAREALAQVAPWCGKGRSE